MVSYKSIETQKGAVLRYDDLPRQQAVGQKRVTFFGTLLLFGLLLVL
ncbi:hypothetical protein [Vibrio sp. 1865]|nr:hypothetical protein [Vibrio sp. 1865]